MKTIGVSEAKTRFLALIEDIERGESVVITKNGTPVARLIRYAEPTVRREFGFDEGRIEISDDFDDTPSDMVDALARA
ncbi:MAG: type II toxin-antitoxin system Phd/YefM family antitoxin [Candidatus Velthaea sp.]